MVGQAGAQAAHGIAATPPPLQDQARELALIANAASLDAAHAVTFLAALGWWDASIEALGDNPARLRPATGGTMRSDLPRLAAHGAREFGRALARMPVSEAHALLGRLYTHALPADHRAALGVHYTPLPLLRRLLDQAENAGHDWGVARAIDPACGHGAFLLEAATRMLGRLAGADPRIALTSLAARLHGWDIDPFAVWLSQVSVEILALPQILSSGHRLGSIAEARDALRDFAEVSGTWDLVMGNPPFGKVKDQPQLRMRFQRSLFGHPNLYGLFTDLAVHLAKPSGGIVAFLTPASFLAGEYFRNLRRVLQEQAKPVTLDLVESRSDVFHNVLQEVVLSTFRRGRRSRSAACAVVHASSAELTIQAAGRLTLPVNPSAPWILPRSPADAGLTERLANMPDRLADWGYAVSTGPLVWNRHKDRLHDTPEQGSVPVIWAEAITPDGRFVLRAGKRNHRAWYRPRSAGDSNLVERACVLVQRTTAKEQRRRLIAAALPDELLGRCGPVAIENHVNMIRPVRRKPAVPLTTLAAFLMTDTADRVFRCINASVAVSASELAGMPVPAATEVNAAMQLPDPDRMLRQLYGLCPE